MDGLGFFGYHEIRVNYFVHIKQYQLARHFTWLLTLKFSGKTETLLFIFNTCNNICM